MKVLKSGLLFLLGAVAAVSVSFAVCVLWPEDHLEAVRTSGPVAFVDVTVVDVRTGTALPSQTVLVEGGRIRSVERHGQIELAAGTRVVAGRGRYLLPAFWDMHTHVYTASPLVDLPLYIAYGVTNVRDMQGCPKDLRCRVLNSQGLFAL